MPPSVPLGGAICAWVWLCATPLYSLGFSPRAPGVSHRPFPTKARAHRRSVRRQGVEEWIEGAGDAGEKLECGLLVFDVSELLLPGQMRYLHLYEDHCVAAVYIWDTPGNANAVGSLGRALV